MNDFHDNNLKMYCNLKRQGDCEATFGENNTQIYMTQCSFLVLGGPIDSGSCPSVKSTFQFQNVLKIPSTTLHESSPFLVSFSDKFNSVTNMILSLVVYDCTGCDLKCHYRRHQSQHNLLRVTREPGTTKI